MSLDKIKLRHRLLVAFFLAVLVGGWFLWNFRRPTYPSTSFDPVAWKQPAMTESASNDPACVRGAMALDLVAKEILLGKSAQQVVELLGAPDERGPADWTYHLGQCPGWGWNDSDLRLTFDEGNTRVKGATFEHVTVSESR